MDYGSMVGDSFAYAKDAVWGKWTKWLMLIIATIILGIPLMGYMMKILRGEKPAPEVTDWGTLFVDGIKYLIVAIIYAIPIFILGFLILGATWMSMLSGKLTGNITAITGAIAGMLVGFLVIFIVAIIIALFEAIGVIRLARTGSIGEAFNFNAILATIGKIGWVSYIIALIVLLIVGAIFGIVMSIIMMIPILGWIIYFCLIPPFALFGARYYCLVYDSAGA
ncbi:MAG: DUF4013 domain-containing protein [Methanoregulaceae archaeon]|jgi:hypothetical protein